VLRGLEWYRNRLIAYSLGNLAGSHTLAMGGVLAQSALLRVTLDARGRLITGSLLSLRLDRAGTPGLDRGRTSIKLIRSLSRTDFPHSALRISAAGTFGPPHPRVAPAIPKRSQRT
jgi:hypothetical protein